jgi:serine/threonine-protein kinase
MSAPSPLPSLGSKRAPGSLAERFWSIAKSAGPSGDDTTSPDPRAVVRHVLRILDALASGEVGDGVSQSTVSFLQLLRQQEQAGDLSYASPEQARGESLDERSLVFSVGVLLFEELTGRHPFGAMASGRRFARIQKGELGSGVQFFPQVPSQLRNVLMKAMGPFPEERYRSLKELRDHLERFAEGRPDETPNKAQRRPLKGLGPSPADLAFTSPEELAPTRIVRRPEPPTPASQPVRVGPVRAVSVMHGPATTHNGTDKVESLRGPSPRTWAILERAAWVAAGALVALVIAYFALRPKAPSSTVPAASAPQPVASPLPARNIEPPSLATEPEPTVFDADLAGRNAAKAARDCFSPERAAKTISFGAGLLFAKDEALSRRVYLSPDEPLSPEERRCINHGLVGMSAGAAPSHNTIVEYRFRLRADGTSDIKAAIQK